MATLATILTLATAKHKSKIGYRPLLRQEHATKTLGSTVDAATAKPPMYEIRVRPTVLQLLVDLPTT
jgi:hypothetical protein